MFEVERVVLCVIVDCKLNCLTSEEISYLTVYGVYKRRKSQEAKQKKRQNKELTRWINCDCQKLKFL